MADAELITDTHHGPNDLPGNAYAVLHWQDFNPPYWMCLGIVVGAANTDDALAAAGRYLAAVRPGLAPFDLMVTKVGGSSSVVQRLIPKPPAPPEYELVDVPASLPAE